LTVPTAALRADSDIPATALMLGIEEAQLRALLQGEGESARATRGFLEIGGRRIELPEGVEEAEVEALIAKRRSGGTLTEEERALLQPILEQVFAGGGDGGPRGEGGFPGGASGGFPPGGFPGAIQGGADASARENRPSTLQYQFGGEYWVIAIRDGQIMPVTVRTGITDLATSEIVAGLEAGDEVLLLPSASLFEQQARLQEFISSRFSSTPFQQQQIPRGRPPF
jgi:hypothetical protein